MFVKKKIMKGLRKFTFGNNGVDFTHDALIKYQAMICKLNIHLLGIRIKPSFLGRLRLIPLGRSFDQGLSSVKDALHRMRPCP